MIQGKGYAIYVCTRVPKSKLPKYVARRKRDTPEAL